VVALINDAIIQGNERDTNMTLLISSLLSGTTSVNSTLELVSSLITRLDSIDIAATSIALDMLEERNNNLTEAITTITLAIRELKGSLIQGCFNTRFICLRHTIVPCYYISLIF
jgi:endonuclease III